METKAVVVHIYGASGSGTSSLGRFLAEKAGFYFMDTDDYYWLPTDPPYTCPREREQRLAMMASKLEANRKTVLSGSLSGWGDSLIPLFSLAVRVVTEKELRLCRLREREQKRFGSRVEPGGDMYRDHIAFLQWAAAYDEGDLSIRSRLEHDLWSEKLPCPRLTVDGAAPWEENAGKILAALKKLGIE